MGFIINESAFNSSVAVHKKNPNTIEFIAILQEANKPNRNGRIYKKEILEQALKAPYVQERLATNSFYMEAGHPADCSVQRQMSIDQRNICALIKEVWWEGDLLKGRIETADTAVGRDMKGLIEMGSRVAFSLRAQGNVHQDPVTGLTIVDAPVQICTYDWVVNPSHAVAYMESVCEETKSAMLYGNRFDKTMALCESANIFENGELIPTDATPTVITEDYTKKYNTQFKKLSEMYRPEDGDTVKSINEKEVIIENGNRVKKVLAEDYLVKDIRSKISAMVLDEAEKPTAEGLKSKLDGYLDSKRTNDVESPEPVVIKESFSDEELTEILKESGFEGNETDLVELKEDLEKGEAEILTEGKGRKVWRWIRRGLGIAAAMTAGGLIGGVVGSTAAAKAGIAGSAAKGAIAGKAALGAAVGGAGAAGVAGVDRALDHDDDEDYSY